MIEADQATEPPPSADDKEAVPPAPAHPVNTVPPEGQSWTEVIDNNENTAVSSANKAYFEQRNTHIFIIQSLLHNDFILLNKLQTFFSYQRIYQRCEKAPCS